VAHVTLKGSLLTPDKVDAARVRIVDFDAEIWLQKGGRSQTTVHWSTPAAAPEQAPSISTQRTVSDGLHVFNWLESEHEYRRDELAEPLFVPYPLPEFFAVFDGPIEERLPTAAESRDFVWSQELGNQPTVVLLDEINPRTEPATWVTFRRESGLPAGYCTLIPEQQGGDTLRVFFRGLEFLTELPKELPPFKTPEGLTEAASAPANAPVKKD
jgi:hypothetical protein